MPQIPAGSWPPLTLIRSVPLADFWSWHTTQSPGTLLPGSGYTTEVYDVLTPVYRGRGEDTTIAAEIQGWTRGLGTPGAVSGVSAERRVAAVFLDAFAWTVQPVTVRFDWIVGWNIAGPDVPYVGSSYTWRPVVGSAGGLDPAPVAQMIQALRVPAPWFRMRIENVGAAGNVDRDTFRLHVWLRSQ